MHCVKWHTKKLHIHWNKNRVAIQERQLYAMRVHLIITKKKRHGRYMQLSDRKSHCYYILKDKDENMAIAKYVFAWQGLKGKDVLKDKFADAKGSRYPFRYTRNAIRARSRRKYRSDRSSLHERAGKSQYPAGDEKNYRIVRNQRRVKKMDSMHMR